ncbi:DUF2946 domain-containing protein [Quisquiliibacterium transsilvanicum]|uniref:DUF2946 domain-containing protein n=1 Tax=Quisquiliibacterium transsilvanicum TaxID=1549638 RepID=A0A7W8HJ20_9BURK|nr:DUF2946 domain-containing protein [Quisquiliibacterium transsilvanicum]MBB5272986.1 hypothetical protein [Quisquiliibacterium transsilvanicum]
MPFALRLRTRIAWLALAAMLMSALAPGISSAMALGTAPEIWGEVCRAEGAAAPDTAPGVPPGHDAGMADCPFCLPQAGAPALPSPERVFAAPADGGSAAPRLFLLAPTASWQWLAAQARAPPTRA